MNLLKKAAEDNKGASTLAVVLLGIIIAAALALWIIVFIGHLGLGEFIVIEPEDSDEEQELSEGEVPGIIEDDTDNEDDDNSGEEPSTPVVLFPGGIPAQAADITLISISEEFPGLLIRLDELAESFNSAAVSLALYDSRANKYYTYEYGFADIGAKREVTGATKFHIASLTKLVTAICVLSLADRDLIDIDTDVSAYFGYEVRNPHFPDTPITIRMLMQHTSSVFDSGAYQVSRDKGSSESVRELIERGTSFRRGRPGTDYEYSNFGFAIIGSLCERVSGKSLDALAREVLFNPLDIDAAYVPGNLADTSSLAVIYDNNHEVSRSLISQLAVMQSDTPGHDLHLAHGNLTISAADYAKILAMLGNGGYFGDIQVLSQSSVNGIYTANVEGAGFMQGLATRYSEDAFISGGGVYWHTGSAYGMYSQYMHSAGQNRGVVVITTGASVLRLDNGMIDACTQLAEEAWGVWETISAD